MSTAPSPPRPDTPSTAARSVGPHARVAAAARRRRAAAVLLSAGAVAVADGCYHYGPVAAGRDAVGGAVRVALVDAPTRTAASDEVARQVGPQAALLDGRLMERSDSGLTLRVETVTRRNGGEEPWREGALVLVPTGAVQGVQTRRLDRTRTVLVVAGAVVGAVLLGAAFGSTGSDVGRSGRGTPGGQQ